jgi:hypothetical protein
LGAAGALALGMTMWNESTLAGVHAPTLALDAALLLLALRYAWRPSTLLAGSAAFLFGLGLTCHLTVLGLGLPLLMGLLAGFRRGIRPAPQLAAVAIAFGLGLSPFALTLAADRPAQPMNYLVDTLEPGETSFAVERPDAAQRIARLRWILSSEQYLGADRRTPRVLAHRVAHELSTLALNELPFGVLLLALAGLVLLLRVPGEPSGYLAAWFASAVVLAGIGGTERTLNYFFLPCIWILCLGLAPALAVIFERSRPAGWLALLALLVLPILRFNISEPPGVIARTAMWRRIWAVAPEEWSPFRDELRYDTYGRGVMQRLAPRASIIGARWDEAETLRYFVFGEPLRPDVEVLYAGRTDARLTRQWRAAVAAGRPAYLTHAVDPALFPGARVVPVWDSGWNGLWRIELAAADSLPGR